MMWVVVEREDKGDELSHPGSIEIEESEIPEVQDSRSPAEEREEVEEGEREEETKEGIIATRNNENKQEPSGSTQG